MSNGTVPMWAFDILTNKHVNQLTTEEAADYKEHFVDGGIHDIIMLMQDRHGQQPEMHSFEIEYKGQCVFICCTPNICTAWTLHGIGYEIIGLEVVKNWVKAVINSEVMYEKVEGMALGNVLKKLELV